MVQRKCVALDIGATKIEAGIVQEDGEILETVKCETPRGSVEAFLDTVRFGVNQLLDSGHSISCIGVGSAGPIDKLEGTISPINLEVDSSIRIIDFLSDLYALPVTLELDTKALALAEKRFGGGRCLKNFVAMVISTGIGAGIVIDDNLLEGDHGNAGHIGHIVVVEGGRLCACGAYGCLEAEASGSAIEAIGGRDPSEADVGLRKRSALLVGQAIGSVGSLLDVNHFFVAGSVAIGYGEPYIRWINDSALANSKMSYTKTLRVELSQLGSSGPLLGAACVAWLSGR